MITKTEWEDAWERVARVFDNSLETNCTYLADYGLCFVIGEISLSMGNDELHDVDWYERIGSLCDDPEEYWLPPRPSEHHLPIHDEWRCLAACFFAAMTPEEFFDMTKEDE